MQTLISQMFTNNIKIFYKRYIQFFQNFIYLLDCIPVLETIYTIANVEIITLHFSFWLATKQFLDYFIRPIFWCVTGANIQIRNSGCLFKIGFKWLYISATVAFGNFLTFTNRFWETKRLSVTFTTESPADAHGTFWSFIWGAIRRKIIFLWDWCYITYTTYTICFLDI